MTATEYVSEAEVNSTDQTKAFAVLNLCLVPSPRIPGSAAPNRSTEERSSQCHHEVNDPIGEIGYRA